MRILHTSDGHVGRTFHGHSTREALDGVLRAVVDLVVQYEVDVVLVAGVERRPLFDRRLAAIFCASVLVNIAIMWLESRAGLGNSPWYFALLLLPLVVLMVPGFLLLRDVFRRRS